MFDCTATLSFDIDSRSLQPTFVGSDSKIQCDPLDLPVAEELGKEKQDFFETEQTFFGAGTAAHDRMQRCFFR